MGLFTVYQTEMDFHPNTDQKHTSFVNDVSSDEEKRPVTILLEKVPLREQKHKEHVLYGFNNLSGGSENIPPLQCLHFTLIMKSHAFFLLALALSWDAYNADLGG